MEARTRSERPQVWARCVSSRSRGPARRPEEARPEDPGQCSRAFSKAPRPIEPTQLPARHELGERCILTLQRGRGSSPDVLLVEVAGGRAVVKDFAPRHPWVRATLGRWLARRELRVYRQLAGHPAVPAVLGRLDALAFALEHRPGPRLSRRRPWTFSPGFAARLGEAVEELHRRGVVHLDLRHRDNVRADMDGNPVLIDFASAWAFRPGGLPARLLLPWLALLDRGAVRKWRRRLGGSG